MCVIGMLLSGRIERLIWCEFRKLSGVLLSVLLLAANAGAFDGGSVNTLEKISVNSQAGEVTVSLLTSTPIGYRYTVYDSLDPVRVVVDLPGTDVTSASIPETLKGFLKNIEVTPFDLTSGKLGRVELLLTQMTRYKVAPNKTGLNVIFFTADSPVISPMISDGIPVKKPIEVDFENTKVPSVAETALDMDVERVVNTPMTKSEDSNPGIIKATNVKIEGKSVKIYVDGKVKRIKSFNLGAPPRMVVDMFDVVPTFEGRAYDLQSVFNQLRIGVYKDKTRFVFDAVDVVPASSIEKNIDSVSVVWSGDVIETTKVKLQDKSIPVTIDAVDFSVDNGHSILVVKTSGAFDKVEPELKDNLVQFAVNNALISQLIKRPIDTSAFPSSVRLITPYTVADGDIQHVKFAVELKGPVKYTFSTSSNELKLIVEDGPFAEASTGSDKLSLVTTRLVDDQSVVATKVDDKLLGQHEDVPVVESVDETSSPSVADVVDDENVVVTDESKIEEVKSTADGGYTGQKISLVFDNADIRKILQLIGEVSDLNILASDDVSGNVTLRLIDVPWDQALDLIMEIQGLGMIQQGNILRIMPKEKIVSMKQQAFTAARTQEKLEDLTTEVISVSYTELSNISGPVKDILSARGKLAEDNRNKQIIITDIPSVIKEVKRLVSILDTPERQVLIEARIVEANSSFSRDLGVSWGVTNTNDNPSMSNPVNASASLGGSFLITPATGQAGFGSSMTFGRLGLDSTVLDLRIGALESSGQGKVVSSPRISTLNGVAAKISSGTKIPYQSSDSGGVAKTEFVDANLSLNVTPVINPDNSVILTIAATNSSVGSLIGDAPTIDTKTADTTVLVKDGQTTVIGGIFIEQETEGETGVPILSDLPLLGHLFKSQSFGTSRSELLIFITPRIVQ